MQNALGSNGSLYRLDTNLQASHMFDGVTVSNGLAWSPDSQSVATCGPNHVIQVWNAATGEPGLQLLGHTGHLWSVAWSPDGRRIASAGADGTVKIWCAATGRDLLPLVQPEPIADLAWTRDGRRLAVVTEKRGVRIYDASAGYDYADGPGLKTDLARHASVAAFCRADSFHNAGQFGRAIAAFTEARNELVTLLDDTPLCETCAHGPLRRAERL